MKGLPANILWDFDNYFISDEIVEKINFQNSIRIFKIDFKNRLSQKLIDQASPKLIPLNHNIWTEIHEFNGKQYLFKRKQLLFILFPENTNIKRELDKLNPPEIIKGDPEWNKYGIPWELINIYFSEFESSEDLKPDFDKDKQMIDIQESISRTLWKKIQ